jgi:hypothetical protein
MPSCLHIPGANLARCGTLRPPPADRMRTSPNNYPTAGHSTAGGAPAGSDGDSRAAVTDNQDHRPSHRSHQVADRPALPGSIASSGSGQRQCQSSSASTRCASPIPTTSSTSGSHTRSRASQVTDILAMSPSRITRPQIGLVEASLQPLLDNLVPPLSASTASTTSSSAASSADLCPPLIHSWMSKCADGALGRDANAERMCLQVRKTFGACSHGML